MKIRPATKLAITGVSLGLASSLIHFLKKMAESEPIGIFDLMEISAWALLIVFFVSLYKNQK